MIDAIRNSAALMIGISLVAGFMRPAAAAVITYSDYISSQAMTINGTAHNCNFDDRSGCAFITITGTGDSSTVTPFSVTGASGFKNTLTSASISVAFNDGTSWNADIDLGWGGMYVSVDQTNYGAGFSSAASPTYPAATYGAAAFGTYDLASDFSAVGWGPFCAVLDVCYDGSPLHTTGGDMFLIKLGFAPSFSAFSSTVAEANAVPEPASALLVMMALPAFVAWQFRSRKRYPAFGARA